MAPTEINLLISSFAGLGLPSTLVLPVSKDASVSCVWEKLKTQLPATCDRLLLTTAGNKLLQPSSTTPISTYASAQDDEFISLRLSAPLCGGKGGFGSQLRAAGGRMSSKRKGTEDTGSSRNLDGRRLRTVNEAKALAEYLAIKPEMEQREKEKRRQRWEQIVELAERREDEIKNGTKARIDGKWVEDKEEAVDMVRAAVLAAMKPKAPAEGSSSTSSTTDSAEESEGSDEGKKKAESNRATPPSDLESDSKGKGKAVSKPKALYGFDEDDEFMSSDSDEE